MRPKRARPKPLTYTLIDPTSEIGTPIYTRLARLVETHHPELAHSDARIAMAWALSWKADVDGRITLGKCKKATDLDRELAPYDFVILLNREFWSNPRVSDLQRDALIDHELHHAALSYDAHGEPKVDERGRTVYRVRKHDLEEFEAIAARYGCWKRDIEAFARALRKAEQQTAGLWIGYANVQTALRAIGVDVDRTVIATWTEEERREVLTWAQLREAADVKVDIRTSQTMPACLAAALKDETQTPVQEEMRPC